MSIFSIVADELGESSRNLDAARRNSGENDRVQIGIALDDFVRDPPQSAR